MAGKRKFSSFTITEVLVALVIVGIGITAMITIYAHMVKHVSYDSRYQKAIESADNYLAQLYLSDDLADDLFDIEEMSVLEEAEEWPLLLDPEEVKISPDIKMLINKNVRRLAPLLVDVGVEMVISYDETNRPNRSFWVESTFSESYLEKIN